MQDQFDEFTLLIVLSCSKGRSSDAGYGGMATTWRPVICFVVSLGAVSGLLLGLLTLTLYPIVGVLLVIAGMALLLYGVAGLCGAQEFKN